MQLSTFNALSAEGASDVVQVWAAVPEFVDDVVAARPFRDLTAVLHTVRRASAGWEADALDVALADHPRIGGAIQDGGAAAARSRREQAGMSAAPGAIVAAMADANLAYERRFGRIFLIRAAGRTPAEMLAEVHRRLGNPPDDEAREAVAQLREIAELRAAATFTEGDPT